MIPEAPVAASRSIDIGVASDVLWRLLTDVSRWPQWYGYLNNARFDDPFACRTALTYGGFFQVSPATGEGRTRQTHHALRDHGRLPRHHRWGMKSMAVTRAKVTFTET